ncbi:MAG TPA: Rrf2 family transcriptional regulator [Candidatus Omnitrophota bacterium]|jgi:Rrf2 family protein|nr:Rrf2 family transcriptional regulator [Candidatus Omnitrophota bacterium]HSA31554.1 Rrf2 family transcriptional regulator [Candidatus Omnitrophota bacterium]
MNLSAKTIYAFKALAELSLRYGGSDPVQVSEIAEAQKIPKKFLIQILIQLKNHGIVRSSRGIAGGYSLVKSPDHLSLADVIKAVDESVFFQVSSARKRYESPLTTILYGIWTDMSIKVEDALKEVTFDKIVSKLNHKSLIYHI